MTNANLSETPPPALPRREQVSMFVDSMRNTTPPVIPEKGHRHTAIMGPSSPIHTATAGDEPAPLPPKKETVLPPKPKPKVNACITVSFQVHLHEILRRKIIINIIHSYGINYLALFCFLYL